MRGVFDFEPWEPVQVKGFDDAVQVYRVLRAKARTFRPDTRGLEAVLSIQDDELRAKTLASYMEKTREKKTVLSAIRQTMIDHLYLSLRSEGREDVLQFCAEESLFTSPVLDGDTLAAIAGHIIDVCERWEWL